MKLQIMVRDMKILNEAVPILETIAKLELDPADAVEFIGTLRQMHELAADAHRGPQRNLLGMADGEPDSEDVEPDSEGV